MEAVSSLMVAAAKLPVLNPNEYELWKMRIEQYFQRPNYALLECNINGELTLLKKTVDGVEKTYPPTTAEEKLARKNELKAKGTLLMALPNEHQLKFNSYKSAKSLMEAIKKRFGGNKESKKVQKTLLKQQYENFNRNRSEGLDQIYDRLEKLINQLEIHGEIISQEDVNLKLLRSLPYEWKTHTLIWRNKSDLDTMSMDDLYNNLKIYEIEVKGSSSTSQNTQNVAFVFSNITGSTNEAVKTTHGVSVANSKANASTSLNVDSLCDLMAILTMKARRFLKKTGRNLRTDTISFDKTKEECYNCHRRGHFAKECRAPKYYDNRNRETTKKTVLVEETTSNALLSKCDGLGYDWSDQAKKGPTNFALMAYTSSGAYKAGLESVEARLDVYKKNEKFEKYEKERNDLKLTLEKFENSSKSLSKLLEIQVCDKFKNGVGFDSQVFDSQVFDSHVNDKYKTDEMYHAVPPPYTRNFMPPKPDLVLATEDESKTLPRRAVSVNTARPINTTFPRPTMNCARPATNVYNGAHSHVKRPFNKFTTNKNSNFNEKVNTVKGHVTTIRPKAVGNPHKELKDKGVTDSGCSRYMTGNISYLTDYEEINGGFVAFGGSTKGKARVETVPGKDYILLPLWTQDPSFSSSLKVSPDARFKPSGEEENKDAEHPENEDNDAVDENIVYECDDDPNMPHLEKIVYSDDDEGIGAEADITNLDTTIPISPIPTTKIHKDHPVEQIIGDSYSAPQTRRMSKNVTEYSMFSSVQQRTNHKNFQNCLFACFLSQVEPKKVIQALSDLSWIEAMQDELLQFKLQKEQEGLKRFEDPEFPNRVYKVEKALYVSTSSSRHASTPMETSKPLLKDAEAEDVDVPNYRSMIGSLMQPNSF
ncbi:putative ribonuclease H-like domain-containing protein [Tanacetum coccineum]